MILSQMGKKYYENMGKRQMTIEERYKLSCYEEVLKLHDTKSIYLVRQIETNNLYVKKKMSIYNRKVYERLQQINIPNIPRIVLCVEDETEFVVVEEYIHGESLQDIYDKNGLFEEGQLIYIMISLCDILEQLHIRKPPIVHRDIKPSNIMLTTDGIVKLIDFNAAKEFDGNRVEDTVLMGTQGFAAPEQYGFGQSDQRTDVYAAGVTMNYLLTGNYPKQQLYGGMLGKIIKLCTAVDANQRYNHVGELRDDLRRLLAMTEQSAKENLDRVQKKQEAISTKERMDETDMLAVKRQKNIFTRSFWNKDWLPVGFRTGVIWKMLIALYGYYLILWCSFTMEVTSNGVVQTGVLMWANRIAALFWMIGTVFIIGNYKHIYDLLPPENKGKKKRWLFVGLYVAIYLFLVIIPVVILENMFS